MGYHAINEGSTIPVYSQSICDESTRHGTLYNGEVFTYIGRHNGYQNVFEIRFRSSNGLYVTGFILDTAQFGNLAYSGVKITDSTLGTCYRFKLRSALDIVMPNGTKKLTLRTGSYVYTTSATCGESNKSNMYIIGYKEVGKLVTSFNGFVTLDYTGGSMFSSNFCIKEGT